MILNRVKEKFNDQQITDIDGVKIDFPEKWVHLRRSNTEPIIRIYSEAYSMEEAEEIGKQIINVIQEFSS
jgi:phosphomannomutase